MRLAVQAVSAVMGGATTYLRAALPLLAARMGDGNEIVLIRSTRNDLAIHHPRIRHVVVDSSPGDTRGADLVRRVRFDQINLPIMLARERASAVFNTANFGSVWSPCPSMVLVRNALYFDEHAQTRVPGRGKAAKLRIQRELCLLAMRAADVVLFPSVTMMRLAARYANEDGRWRVAPFGVRHDLFRPATEESTRQAGEPFRLAHVSFYADHKNLVTPFSALQRIAANDGPSCHLTLTCGIQSNDLHDADWLRLADDRRLFAELEKSNLASDLGPLSNADLPAFYAGADAFVWPSYTESFGHPVIEAMACGLPIIAADTPINREQCGDAAIYFAPFDVEDCARAIANVARDSALRARLRRASLEQAQAFTWEAHVDAVLDGLSDATSRQWREAAGVAAESAAAPAQPRNETTP